MTKAHGINSKSCKNST